MRTRAEKCNPTSCRVKAFCDTDIIKHKKTNRGGFRPTKPVKEYSTEICIRRLCYRIVFEQLKYSMSLPNYGRKHQ